MIISQIAEMLRVEKRTLKITFKTYDLDLDLVEKNCDDDEEDDYHEDQQVVSDLLILVGDFQTVCHSFVSIFSASTQTILRFL